jgi:hypothetical protein
MPFVIMIVRMEKSRARFEHLGSKKQCVSRFAANPLERLRLPNLSLQKLTNREVTAYMS